MVTTPARIAVIALAAVLLAGCGRSRRAWQPPVLPTGVAGPAAYGVVLLSTPLSTAPRQNAPAVFGVSPVRIYGGTSEPAFAVARVLGQEGSWVAIETLGEAADGHCVPDVAGLEALRLRLFVPASALVPVTQREIVQPFDDGTRIELARGVPVEPLPQRGLHRVRLGSLRAVVRLAAADIGTRYLPSSPRALLAPARALDADAVAAGAPILGRTGRVDGTGSQPVYAETVRGAEALVELRPPCGRLVVRVPAHAVADAETTDAPSPVIEPLSGAPTVRAGTPIRWRDGRDAGVVTRTVALERETEPSSTMRCFLHSLREPTAADPTPELELCFDRRSVIEDGLGRGRRLDRPAR